MLDRLPRAPAVSDIPKLLATAETVMLLPNATDNLADAGRNRGRLAEYHQLRQAIYSWLVVIIQQSRGSDRVEVLRRLMWLDVSRRSAGQLTPAFADTQGTGQGSVVKWYRDSAGSDKAALSRLDRRPAATRPVAPGYRQ